MPGTIDIEDKTYQPGIEEICAYVHNRLFDELCLRMDSEYRVQQRIEYSGDKVLLGWNVKFKRSGKTLCTVYPREGHFPMLLVVGRKEKLQVEDLLPQMSDGFREVYRNTPEGMGQRWLLLDFVAHTDVYDDAWRVIEIRRQTR